ncbi:MAG: response regulator transcription factor [Actinobacteria bacterium]|nr:response regulator transcription factor [Actinomycetota bacterium]
MTRLLVVEDDPDIALALRLLLDRSGYTVEHAADGRTGLRLVHEVRPDLLVLDIGLPVMDGWQVLERVRDISDLPILLLTAHGQETDKVRGLRGGADDYLTKPFTNSELLARVEALLRRSGPGEWAADLYDDGMVRVDPRSRQVRVADRDLHLTPTEFRLLNMLLRNAGAVLSPVQLLTHAWDDPTGIGPERVKFGVLRLRRKLGWDDPATSPIEAVRGVGYRYRPPA